MASEIKHADTPEIVCPHCGFSHCAEPWEQDSLWTAGSQLYDCNKCHKEYSCRVKTTYTTAKEPGDA